MRVKAFLPPSETVVPVAVGATAFAATSLIVFLAVATGVALTNDAPAAPTTDPEVKGVFLNADGEHYLEIAREGYRYNPTGRSSVAFFPLFPLATRAVAATGLAIDTSLVLVANTLLFAAFIVLSIYARGRNGNSPLSAAGYAVVAFGAFPTTFFFHMAYAESCFLFLAVLAMLSMERRWPLLAVAVIVGLATASRPVGVALVPVFWLHVWQRCPKWRGAFVRWIALTPIALAGLIAYMAYQDAALGDPLAFAKTQEHWRRRGHVSTGDKVIALLSYEPIWSVYESDSPAYWRRLDRRSPAVANLALANPIYFLLAVALVILGAWNRWLNSRETLLAALLLLIPYITRSYEMCMLSQGRFMAVVFPIYLVMGHILSRIPGPYAAMVVGLSEFYFAVYTIHFAAGYPLI